MLSYLIYLSLTSLVKFVLRTLVIYICVTVNLCNQRIREFPECFWGNL